MATAQIKINGGTPGSNTDLPLNTPVNLSNSDNTGVTTWEWTILSQPAGTAVTLSSLSASTTSFTSTKEGSYLLRLVVNKGLAGEATNQVVAAVRELETRSRIPAAGETIEVDTDNGWSNAAVSEILQRVTRFTDNGILVGKAGQSLTPQQVVHISDATEIGVLPAQQRTVPSFEVAYANNMNHLYGTLGVYLETVTGAPSASIGALVRVMSLGPISGVTLAAGGVGGDPVYVNDTGALSLTPGTHSRQIGTIAHVMSPTTYDLWISGLGGAAGTPVGPAGGILGYPSSTYPNPNGLAADSANAIPLAPYTGNTYVNFVGDNSTTADGTSIGLTAGATTNAGSTGGGIELDAGYSNTGAGGAIALYSGAGTTGGQINLFVGASTAGVGTALSLHGGNSTLATAGTKAGNVNITGGDNTSIGTLGGDVVITGGYGAAAPGGKLLLGGGVGTVGSIAAGAVTLQGQDGATAGMSGGSVSLLAGTGGSAGQAGAITITAGNSTYSNAAADGGAVTITAGSNTTAAGQGGNVVLTSGAASGATGAVLTIYGANSDTNKKSNIELIAGGSTTIGQHVKLAGGAGTASNGNVYIGGGAGAGAAGQVYIGSSGVVNGPTASDVFIGTTGKTNTIKGDTLFGVAASTNTIQGTTTIGGSSQVTTIKGIAVIGDNGTTATRLVLSPYTQALTSNSDTLLLNGAVLRVTASVSAINLASTPTITTAGVAVGTRLLIFNAGSNNVTLNNDPNTPNTKLKLGANSRVLGAGDIIELIYMTDSANNSYWYEIAFRG